MNLPDDCDRLRQDQVADQRQLPPAANWSSRPIGARRFAPNPPDNKPGFLAFSIYEAAVHGHRRTATSGHLKVLVKRSPPSHGCQVSRLAAPIAGMRSSFASASAAPRIRSRRVPAPGIFGFATFLLVVDLQGLGAADQFRGSSVSGRWNLPFAVRPCRRPLHTRSCRTSRINSAWGRLPAGGSSHQLRTGARDPQPSVALVR